MNEESIDFLLTKISTDVYEIFNNFTGTTLLITYNGKLRERLIDLGFKPFDAETYLKYFIDSINHAVYDVFIDGNNNLVFPFKHSSPSKRPIMNSLFMDSVKGTLYENMRRHLIALPYDLVENVINSLDGKITH